MNVNFHLSSSEHIEMVIEEMEMNSSMMGWFHSYRSFYGLSPAISAFLFQKALNKHLPSKSLYKHPYFRLSEENGAKVYGGSTEKSGAARVTMSSTGFHPTQELHPDYWLHEM